MNWMDHFRVDVPPGMSGKWTVDHFEISKDSADRFNLHEIISGSPSRQVQPGKYVRLKCKGRGVIMSNTPAELRDHIEPWQKAKGTILINGLGLGAIVAACLRKNKPGESVDRCIVVEKERDVIKLVAPTLFDEFGRKRLQIVLDDAFTFEPPAGVRFNMVWHDIWDAIDCDNRPEMSKLHRRYGRRCDWQDSWGRYDVDRMNRADREQRHYFG